MRPLRLVTIDDQPAMLQMLADAIELSPDVVLAGAARTAAEGLLVAEMVRPDAVITDHDMPGATGSQAAVWLRELQPDVGIVLFTGVDRVADLREADSVDHIVRKTAGVLAAIDAAKQAALARGALTRDDDRAEAGVPRRSVVAGGADA